MVFYGWTMTAILLPLLVFVSPHCTRADLLPVTWISPAESDIYSPGSYLVGQWTTDTQVVFPTFKLCNIYEQDEDDYGATEADRDDCGASVQPSVQGSDDGLYEITLAVPSVTRTSTFRLEMEDSFGSTSSSPTFTLSRDVTTGVSPVASSLDNGAGSLSDPLPSSAMSGRPHRAISPAAYVVPLSFAAVIIFVAAIVGAHHRRKLAVERSRQSEEFKTFRSQFTDDLGRLRGLSMWATHLTTGRSRGSTTIKVKKDDGNIFTPVYVPYLAQEKHGSRRPRSTTREPFGSKTIASGPIPASVLKASASPRISVEHQFLPKHKERLYIPATEYEAGNSTVTGAVLSHYMQPSPMPSSVPTPLKPAYVRRYSSAAG